jgi:hypothetical protein
MAIDCNLDSIKRDLRPHPTLQARLAKHLHHVYRNTLEVLLVYRATLVWPSGHMEIIPGDMKFSVNGLRKEFLQDHYNGIKRSSPVVSFFEWPQGA